MTIENLNGLLATEYLKSDAVRRINSVEVTDHLAMMRRQDEEWAKQDAETLARMLILQAPIIKN